MLCSSHSLRLSSLECCIALFDLRLPAIALRRSLLGRQRKKIRHFEFAARLWVNNIKKGKVSQSVSLSPDRRGQSSRKYS